MENWSSYPQVEEYLDVSKMSMNSNIPSNAITPVQSNSSIQDETLQQLKFGLAKMMSTMERLEQRLNRVEQTTSTILKNQQETLQVPFMSQTDLDKARQVAEQLEHDTNVAKQLQAAYNKEAEVKKTTTSISYQAPRLAECPLCGGRFAQPELEGHVNQCLELFSSDPKKEKQVAQVKQQKESGFFGKFFDFHKTSKTETTKVITRTTSSSSSATAPLLTSQENEGMMQNFYPSPYGYPQFNNTNNGGVPMMMPMYMYPTYPSTHMNNHE